MEHVKREIDFTCNFAGGGVCNHVEMLGRAKLTRVSEVMNEEKK